MRRIGKKMTGIKYYFLCAFFLSTLSCFGQRADTLTIYYPINDFQLQNEAQNQLNNALSAANIKTIQVLGYADYLGSAGYNLLLSAKRAEAVKAFLMKKNYKMDISANGKGQVNEDVRVKQGDPKARKVEIIIEHDLAVPPPVMAVEPVKKDTPVAAVVPPQNDIIKGNEVFEARIDSLFKGGAGTDLTLNELNFIGGRHLLTPRSTLYLPVLVKCLLKYSDIRIQIIGHICCDYSSNDQDGYDFDSKSYGLSKNRAKAIYDYLKAHGVSTHRMQYKGVGNSQPKVYPEVTNDDSDINRRVEILIVNN